MKQLLLLSIIVMRVCSTGTAKFRVSKAIMHMTLAGNLISFIEK